MDKFYIITNRMKDESLTVTRMIASYLQEKGKQCMIQEAGYRGTGSYHYTDAQLIPPDVECIIVLGGDGTLLQAARDVVDLQIPLLGINLGTLGYLAEIDRDSVYAALDQMVAGKYEIEKRMMLQGRVFHQGEQIAEDIALNDIVITRDGRLRIVGFNNYVNNEFLNSYKADGIIISTATGSTGYSLSAGGPIISPEANVLMMTPIAPHTLNRRSIIFPAEDEITVEIAEGKDKNQARAVVLFDGDTEVPLTYGDRVMIRKAAQSTKFVKISNISFLEVLRQKMN
ncbi:MAG: NAD(+)/NADH kinase [Lachnospiraceae bacterium]|jgi:NAD+ kinase